MYQEEEFLPVSALQHLVFCERQWALIHLEQLWVENILTAQGRVMHERVHEHDREVRDGIIITRGLPLKSLRLGLTGKADVVEFVAVCVKDGREGIPIEGQPGLWKPVPVEYKHGKPKVDRSDEVQLCAQALCIEEMLGVSVTEGAIYYGRPRRRHSVSFDEPLRAATEEAVLRLHYLTREGRTPAAVYRRECNSCSLYEYCLPRATGGGKNVSKYLQQVLDELDIE
ncbi:MAG: CRISPR-associated protein Cas4 [Syntrophothermus sp.]|uniref:CRISPR-associated protein Cas4 n=1 Tax=Syntrophothermus sp. TaxID=2736299 RepID=UPI0025805E0D|nr:CRISPR-associated protein Cas4 [Syntrophothermus sp.]NSW83326.1 CRISPR-associated protein Cas4 [Syntrophothermus sp.]